jgi:hypothetical protein
MRLKAGINFCCGVVVGCKKPLKVRRGNPLLSRLSRAISHEGIAATPGTIAPLSEPTTLMSDKANTADAIRI